MLDRRTFLFSLAAAVEAPVHWSGDRNLAWTAELAGTGHSTPAVFRDRIFVTSSSGTDLFAELLDTGSGAQLWVRRMPSSSPAESLATPSPLAEAERYFALYASGDLAGFDQTGNTLWRRRLAEGFGAIDSTASLARTHDAVVAYFSARGRNFLAAADPQTGKLDWRTERPVPGASGTPVVATAWNRQVVVVCNRGVVEGFSVVDGQLLWRREDMPRDSVIAPAEGSVVLGSAIPTGSAMLRLNPPGREPDLVWKAEQASSAGALPLFHEGFVYFASPGGVLFCLNAETGKQVWTAPLKLSPAVALLGDGSRIFAFLQDGTTFVYETGKSPRKLGENALPAAAPLQGVRALDGAFLLRGPNRLFRVGAPAVSKPRPAWGLPKA